MGAMSVNKRCVLSFLLLLCIGQYVLFHWLLQDSDDGDDKPANLLPNNPLKGVDHDNTASNIDQDKGTAYEPTVKRVVQHSHLTGKKSPALPAGSNGKIAVLLPYLGKVLPSWFDLFAFSASASASLIDWYIFITEAPSRATPSNVHLIRVSRTEMFQRLARLDQTYINATAGRDKLESYFQYIIDVHPYILVEIKPALGFLFADYAEGYSHWAYADLDLLVGNMHLQITPEQLAKHDIITLAFGDNNRLYMRGQFTIHKNTPEVSQLWTGCEYLSHIGTRMEAFFEEKTAWAFQSAEGCYSKVVADNPDLLVQYVPVQFSDAFAAPMEQKETIMLGSALLRCYGADLSPEVMASASEQALRVESSASSLEKMPLGRITHAPHCSYWIDPLYQVCTEYVPANATILIETGRMSYTQERKYAHEHCREASIAHFQGWKRAYYSYTTRVPPRDAHAMVISDVGVVPLRLPSHLQLMTYAQLFPTENVICGRINSVTTTLAGSKNTEAQERKKGPIGQLDSLPEDEQQVSSYCIRFSGDLKKCERYLRTGDIQVLQVGKQSPNEGVTLISAGWMNEYMAHKYDQLLSVFDGPKVLVLAYIHGEELKSFVAHSAFVTLITVNFAGATSASAEENGSEEWIHLPDKTLYNIGLDAAGATVALIVPNTIIFRAFSIDPSSTGAKFKLSGKVVTEALLAASHPESETSQPAALVVPMFAKHFVADGGDVPMRSGSEIQYEAYPVLAASDRVVHSSQCGLEQPDSLLPSWDRAKWAGEPSLPFNSGELCRESTVMPPIIFNTTDSPHGSGFVRFPEELNGVGCFGANILRVLAGSGYALRWYPASGASQGMYAQHTGNQITALLPLPAAQLPRSALKNTTQPASKRRLTTTDATESTRRNASARASVKRTARCGCLYGDTNKRWEMIVKTNKYFLKAVELRTLGLSNTYARERFGVTFEEDQLKEEAH